MKLNNKGFAISAILYSLLLIFILFTLVVLSNFNNSITSVNAANEDLVNGTKLMVEQLDDTSDSNKVIRCITNYGIMYYPRDFENGKSKLNNNINIKFGAAPSHLMGSCSDNGVVYITPPSNVEHYCAYVKDELTGRTASSIISVK